MKCPKCGYDNPPNTVFCEECDWRLDQKVEVKEKQRNPLAFSAVSFVLGLITMVLYFVEQPVAAVVVGAVGMVLGGYSVNLPRFIPGSNKTLCMALAALGIMLSIIGFLFGLVDIVD